jgi:hypothetical protein
VTPLVPCSLCTLLLLRPASSTPCFNKRLIGLLWWAESRLRTGAHPDQLHQRYQTILPMACGARSAMWRFSSILGTPRCRCGPAVQSTVRGLLIASGRSQLRIWKVGYIYSAVVPPASTLFKLFTLPSKSTFYSKRRKDRHISFGHRLVHSHPQG